MPLEIIMDKIPESAEDIILKFLDVKKDIKHIYYKGFPSSHPCCSMVMDSMNYDTEKRLIPCIITIHMLIKCTKQ
jgi:Mg-chelatase subunit ChlI